MHRWETEVELALTRLNMLRSDRNVSLSVKELLRSRGFKPDLRKVIWWDIAYGLTLALEHPDTLYPYVFIAPPHIKVAVAFNAYRKVHGNLPNASQLYGFWSERKSWDCIEDHLSSWYSHAREFLAAL